MDRIVRKSLTSTGALSRMARSCRAGGRASRFDRLFDRHFTAVAPCPCPLKPAEAPLYFQPLALALSEC